MDWHQAIEKISPLVVRISTPQGSGTGFLVSHSTVEPICGIATAAHVVEHAYAWEQPIRIEHHASGKSILLRHQDRAVFIEEHDTAAIVFSKNELPIPNQPPQITPEGKTLKPGVEVGWLGFPAISPKDLCFFSGRASCYLKKEHAYLVDGVAINGVSGGPTFFLLPNGYVVVGVVSAYIANRATGETLPGLSIIRDVTQFQALEKRFKSVDEAKQKEVPLEKPLVSTPEAKNEPDKKKE